MAVEQPELGLGVGGARGEKCEKLPVRTPSDRKSTRLNSSHSLYDALPISRPLADGPLRHGGRAARAGSWRRRGARREMRETSRQDSIGANSPSLARW